MARLYVDDVAVQKALKKVGGLRPLARLLGINPQNISRWKRCPAGYVLTLERLTGVPRYELRPDLYPPNEYRCTKPPP